jgi:hypothetical protein
MLRQPGNRHRSALLNTRSGFFYATAIAVVLGMPAGSTSAADPLHRQIDKHIVAKTPGFQKIAAPQSSDAEFIRRITLDLTGTIPTTKQVQDFLADKSPNKRTKIIDRLLNTPEYARHLQRRFDVMLMRRLPQKNVTSTEWQTFLRKSFAANKPWDQLVREILSADGTDPKNRGPASFYLDRNGDVNVLTQDIGRVFLGANLECAQCHDHPEIDDYKQATYYGISAFYVRSYVIKDKKLKKSVIAEKGIGEVSFESVFDIRDKKSKGPKSTTPAVFTAKMKTEPKFKKGQEYKRKPTKTIGGIPKFSRRDKFPAVMTSTKNTRFARTAVNRLWEMYLGRGIVHPVDMDHSDNPPSHPKLLNLLTREFQAHKYDIKWLIREIVLTETYQRSSRKPKANKTAEPPAEETFAVAILRPLTPAQLAWAVLEATGQTAVQRKSLAKKLTEPLLHSRLASYEKRFVALFGGQPGKPPEDFQSSVDQVLFLSNDNTVMTLIRPRAGNLADRLGKVPANQPDKIAQELFLGAFSRQPTKEETADITAYLKNTTGPKRATAIQELVWAMVTSAEFRFNH